MNERSRVRVPAEAVGEVSSPGREIVVNRGAGIAQCLERRSRVRVPARAVGKLSSHDQLSVLTLISVTASPPCYRTVARVRPDQFSPHAVCYLPCDEVQLLSLSGPTHLSVSSVLPTVVAIPLTTAHLNLTPVPAYRLSQT